MMESYRRGGRGVGLLFILTLIVCVYRVLGSRGRSVDTGHGGIPPPHKQGLANDKDSLAKELKMKLSMIGFGNRSGVDGVFVDGFNADILTQCQAFIDAYSSAAANYTRCAIQHARPLMFCEECVEEYATAVGIYHSLLSETVHEDNITLCSMLVLNSDRVQIIVKTDSYIEELWRNCDCRNCFMSYGRDANGTFFANLTNGTKNFHELVNETLLCFGDEAMPAGLSTTSEPKNSSVCVKCFDIYDQLNDLYQQLESDQDHHVCMDIVDMMNSTRSLWSNKYGCNLPPADMWAVFALSSVFSLAPIIFYVGARMYGVRQQHKIVTQRRLRDVSDHTMPGTSHDEQDDLTEACS